MTCCCLCLTSTLSDCSLASLSSAVSAANLTWLEAVICRSLASLSSAVSSASLSVIRCSLAYLTSSVSTTCLRLLCWRSAPLLHVFCKIRLQSVKLCEHRICGMTYVRYLIHTCTYIQRKCTADMTSVGLAQARPN